MKDTQKTMHTSEKTSFLFLSLRELATDKDRKKRKQLDYSLCFLFHFVSFFSTRETPACGCTLGSAGAHLGNDAMIREMVLCL